MDTIILVIMNKNKTLFIRVERLVKKAFVINSSIPKGYGINSSDYSKFYKMKVELCNKAIHLIRENHLSIKYGWSNEGILYFNIRENQFSFHGINGHGMKRKSYNGTWIGTRNPLEFGEMYRLSKTMKKKSFLPGQRQMSCYM